MSLVAGQANGTVDYYPARGGASYDPVLNGGAMTSLTIFAADGVTVQATSTSSVKVADGRYRFTVAPALAAPGSFTATVVYSATGTGPVVTDTNERVTVEAFGGSTSPGLLVSVAELESYLRKPAGSVPVATGTLVLTGAQAVVEGTIRQPLLQTTSTHTIQGTPEQYLDLPQRPVTAVASVSIDGTPMSDWVRYGSRLWRAGGWQQLGAYQIRSVTLEWITGRFVRQPSQVTVTYTHGYAPGAPELELARQCVFMLAAEAMDNPTAKDRMRIDDFEASGGLVGLALPIHLVTALRRKYGVRRGSVRPS